MRTASIRVIAFLTVILTTLLGGCATTGGPAQRALPEGFELRRAALAVAPQEQPVIAAGIPGRALGAAGGATAGAVSLATTQFVAQGIVCLALGPFAGACFAALGPAVAVAGAIGAASGAVVGAAVADDKETYEAKRAALLWGLAGRDPHDVLLGHVRAQAKAAYALDIPLAEASDQSPSARWVLTISRLQIGTTLTEPDARVALVVLAHVDVSPHGAATPSSGADYRVESDAKRTAPEWAEGEGALARREIDELMAQVATRMLVHLSASR